jgi:hypothetical protein
MERSNLKIKVEALSFIPSQGEAIHPFVIARSEATKQSRSPTLRVGEANLFFFPKDEVAGLPCGKPRNDRGIIIPNDSGETFHILYVSNIMNIKI